MRPSLYPWFCSALALAAAPSADGYGTSPHAAVIPTPRAETQGKRKAPALLELWQGIGAICSRAQLPSTLAVVDSCESRAPRGSPDFGGAVGATILRHVSRLVERPHIDRI